MKYIVANHRPGLVTQRVDSAQIAEHLSGTWRDEHLFNLTMGVRRYDEIERVITDYDTQLRRWIAELQPPERREASAPAHPNAAKEKAIRARGERSG